MFVYIKTICIFASEPTKTNNMNTFQTLINNELKKGNVIITRNGLLGQDFETKDGVLKCKAVRFGGGFTMGFTLHEVKRNGVNINNRNLLPTDNLTKIYGYFVVYCKNKFAY